MPVHRHRNCRPHERKWQRWCVDRGLKDEWLVKLNALQAFRLVSICEGHARDQRGSGNACPHINLRMESDLADIMYRNWEQMSSYLSADLRCYFNPDTTRASAELDIRIPLDSDVNSSFKKLVVRLSCVRRRASEDMESEIVEWFENVVTSCRWRKAPCRTGRLPRRSKIADINRHAGEPK